MTNKFFLIFSVIAILTTNTFNLINFKTQKISITIKKFLILQKLWKMLYSEKLV